MNKNEDQLIVECVSASYSAIKEKVKDHPRGHEILFRVSILIAARVIAGAGKLGQTAAIVNLNAFVEGLGEAIKEYYLHSKKK